MRAQYIFVGWMDGWIVFLRRWYLKWCLKDENELTVLRNGKIHYRHSKQYSSLISYSSEFKFNSKINRSYWIILHWLAQLISKLIILNISLLQMRNLNLQMLFYHLYKWPKSLALVRVKLGFYFKKFDSGVYSLTTMQFYKDSTNILVYVQ